MLVPSGVVYQIRAMPLRNAVVRCSISSFFRARTIRRGILSQSYATEDPNFFACHTCEQWVPCKQKTERAASSNVHGFFFEFFFDSFVRMIAVVISMRIAMLAETLSQESRVSTSLRGSGLIMTAR